MYPKLKVAMARLLSVKRRAATSLLLAFVSLSTAWATQPYSDLNECAGFPGSVYVRGWCFDPDAPTTSIDVHVYLFRDAACKNQYTARNVGAANESSTDVTNAYGVSGNHRFSRFVAAEPGTYYVKVYAIDANGNGNPEIKNGTTAGPFNVTVSAPYVVSYDGNGGTGAPSAQNKNYGITLTLSSDQPTREGFRFTGWNTAANGTGTSYAAGATYTADVAATLYAQWEDIRARYTITFDANGGEGAPEAQTKTEGEDLTLATTVPTRNGFNFLGWNTMADGNGTTYAAGANYTANAAATLYAQWEDIRTRYLAYNTELEIFETAFASEEQEVTSGSTTMGATDKETWYVVKNNVTISNRIECAGTVNLILCDGATFKANAGMHVKSGTNLNVYAQSGGTGSLIATQGTVDISCVGGNSAETSGEITIHGGIISITCAGRAAAIGGGWYGNASKTVIHGGKVTARCQGEYGCAIGGGLNGGGGTVIITGGEVLAEGLGRASSGIGAGSLWAIGGNLTITGGTVVAKSGKDAKAIGGGIWVEQDGTVNLVDMIVYASEDSNEPVANEERINTCRSAYVKLVHCDNHSFNDNGDCIYCAARAWYTVAYDGNGNTEGDAPVDETRYYPGQNTTVTVLGIPDNFKRTGYMFVGWNTMADGNGTHYAANATFTISQVITLYAQWEKVYTIAFDANGGTGAPEAQTKTEGEDLTLATTVPTRTGFNFLGWNTMADGKGTSYAAGDAYTADAAVTLYAQWEDIRERYTLTYDANGGTGAPETQTKIKGEDLTLATSEPTREGYKFMGWSTSAIAHDYVDLGLPSNTLWATCNVGADNPEDYGKYYAWGETKAYGEEDETNAMNYSYNSSSTYVKTYYDWSTYKYCNGSYNSQTKYCTSSSYGTVDNKTALEADDDAATVNWGGTWRMPTHEEWQELYNNTTSEWITLNGVNGRKFTASNGNYIFLPAAGYRSGTSLYGVGSNGYYWSASLYKSYPNTAWSLYFSSGRVDPDYYYNRYYGRSVRAVTKGSPIYAAGGTYTADAAVTLYAQWEKVYTITYDANGGEGAPEPQTKIKGEDLTLATTVPTREGYKFVGWKALDTHDYVDLGLSVLWATCNLGAEKSEDYGNYYVWGETEDKNSYGWETYKYCQGTENSITKYNDTDGLTELELADDAAYVNWGSAWRIPSEKEWQELVNNTASAWTTENGVNGYKFTASNGNYIFLPAAGAHSENRLFDDGGQGHYASRTLKYPISMWELNFVPTYVVVNYYAREYGYTVRPVTDGRGGTIYAAGDTYTTNSNVTLCAQWEGALSQDANGNYVIANTDAWNAFAQMVAGGEIFSGKTVKLVNNDVVASTMVGTSSNKFSGTFDGGGHTLTVNYNTTTEEYTAPFRFTNGATIENLHITGSIQSSKKFAASIIASASGTTRITGCTSTASITGTISGDGTHGGFIGIAENNSTTNFTDCVFRGKLLGASTTYNGGFLGYVRSGSSSYTNCLFDPAELTMSTSGSCTFNRNTTPTMSGAYYTQTFGQAQGIQVFSEVPSKSLYKSLSIMGYNFFRTCDISGVNDLYENTGTVITPTLSVKFAGTELSADDYSVTFTHNGALANEVKEAGEYTMTVTGNEANGYCGTWSKTFKVCFGRDAEGNYIIANNDDWSLFASKITNGETFSGKTVKLASDDVTVTERVPSTFAGTFDGCGKTLTVNLSGGNEELAIFTTISNATIQNLHITGTINFARHRPASIASYVAGTSTVKNCWSDVNIISNYTSSDWVDGGALIARVNNGCTLNMSDCRFTGTFAYHANNHEGGGMVGWTQDANATANLTNCLFAPSSLTMTKENTKQLTYIFVSGNKRGILTNCFYNGVAANTTVLKKEGTRVFDEPQTTLCKKVTLFGTDYYAQCDVLGVEDYYCYNEGQTIELDPKVFAGSDVMTSEDYTLTMTYNGASATEVKERGEYVITITGNNGNEVFGTWSKTFHVIGVDCDTDGNYVIANADDWNTFATMVANVESFSGKTVKLANSDITVTTMVGTEANPFCGTFDGGGNTLTFNYSTDADNAAPFQWIKNAVIKNMTVTGEITTSKMFAAGFVARAHGNNAIENCVSSVTIHASKNGDGTHGGFVGRIESDCKTFTFTDCLFNGTFDGINTDNWCPFAAWSMGGTNTNFVFNDCLYAPTSVNVRNGNATFYRNGTPTLNGAYYTQALGTVQGTQVFIEVQTTLYKKVTLFGTEYYAVCAISGVQTEYFCSEGKPVNVGLVVDCGGKALAETDYTIAYTCNGEAVDAVTKGGEYVMTIAGNEEAGCFGTATASFTVITDEDVFVVNYDLADSWGDGWNGCAINVIEKALATTVNTLTINGGKSASGELMLDAGKVYTFAWKAGSWANETSWTFNDGDGDLLFSGGGNGLSTGHTIYELLTSARPYDLSVTEPEIGDFELSWQSYEGHHDSWDVAYKSNTATNFTIVEGVTSNPYTLENLPVATEYTFKVRGRKEGLTTKWSDEVTYTLPVPEITLANNATNNGTIVAKTDGRLCNVTLANRTIYRDGDWNTLVLPFEVDLTDEDSPLFGATARPLASASLTNNGQTLTLNFDEPVNKLEAGVPYIIKWTEKCETDIVNPVFPYVPIDATDNIFCSDDRLVRFVGTYDLVTFDDENKDVLFLGGGNNLYYPDGKATTTIGACRAYFKIGNDDFVADAAHLRSIVMDFGEESETVTIENVRVTTKEEIWFTLDGRRLKGKPNEKGLFIHNGKTVVE